MEMDYRYILRELREDAGLTQAELAGVLGISQTMYARYERGVNELPVRHLAALSRYYRVSTDYILGLDGRRRRPGPPRGGQAER